MIAVASPLAFPTEQSGQGEPLQAQADLTPASFSSHDGCSSHAEQEPKSLTVACHRAVAYSSDSPRVGFLNENYMQLNKIKNW